MLGLRGTPIRPPSHTGPLASRGPLGAPLGESSCPHTASAKGAWARGRRIWGCLDVARGRSMWGCPIPEAHPQRGGPRMIRMTTRCCRPSRASALPGEPPTSARPAPRLARPTSCPRGPPGGPAPAVSGPLTPPPPRPPSHCPPPRRPCCSKSDDFYTFGSIFLEKGFEREVRALSCYRGVGPKAWGGVGDPGQPHAGCVGRCGGLAPAGCQVGRGLHLPASPHDEAPFLPPM